jgi:hypothetical protein
MSDWLSRPVWKTLPPERQHALMLALGQMAMRQIRSTSTVQQIALGETADDDGIGSYAAAAGRPVREDLSATP